MCNKRCAITPMTAISVAVGTLVAFSSQTRVCLVSLFNLKKPLGGGFIHLNSVKQRDNSECRLSGSEGRSDEESVRDRDRERGRERDVL